MVKQWAEELPEDCPPKEAKAPQDETFFRLANNPPLEDDFFSHRKLFPSKFFNTTECIARSLSLWNNLENAQSLQRLPTLKNKLVVKIILRKDDGLVLQTGRNPAYFSWWRTTNFDISKWEILAR